VSRIFFPSCPPAPTTPSEELSASHEQLLALTNSVELLLRELESSSCIAEDLAIAQWKLKQCALLVDESSNACVNLAPDQRMGFMHEYTEKESKLAVKIAEQQRFKKLQSASFDTLHAEAVKGGNPFVYDVDAEDEEDVHQPIGVGATLPPSNPLTGCSSINCYTVSPMPTMPIAQFLEDRGRSLFTPDGGSRSFGTAVPTPAFQVPPRGSRHMSMSSSSSGSASSVRSPMLSPPVRAPPGPPPPRPLVDQTTPPSSKTVNYSARGGGGGAFEAPQPEYAKDAATTCPEWWMAWRKTR
jgi:hypothetical protein